MSEEKLHFWYSDESWNQQAFYEERQRTKCVALINGREVPYTECNKRKSPASIFVDLVYLGQGTVFSINGIEQ